ncbi:MAG: hypothetical protein AB7P76_03625 [Candidatus Melainabacteria bacterium]
MTPVQISFGTRPGHGEQQRRVLDNRALVEEALATADSLHRRHGSGILTEREADCIRAVLDGETGRKTAKRLGIPQPNVTEAVRKGMDRILPTAYTENSRLLRQNLPARVPGTGANQKSVRDHWAQIQPQLDARPCRYPDMERIALASCYAGVSNTELAELFNVKEPAIAAAIASGLRRFKQPSAPTTALGVIAEHREELQELLRREGIPDYPGRVYLEDALSGLPMKAIADRHGKSRPAVSMGLTNVLRRLSLWPPQDKKSSTG